VKVWSTSSYFNKQVALLLSGFSFGKTVWVCQNGNEPRQVLAGSVSLGYCLYQYCLLLLTNARLRFVFANKFILGNAFLQNVAVCLDFMMFHVKVTCELIFPLHIWCSACLKIDPTSSGFSADMLYLLMFVLRLNDAVLTFVISNRTQSPWGKAGVLYMRLSVSLATLLFLLFQVPELVFSDLVTTPSNKDTRRSVGAKLLYLFSPHVASKAQVKYARSQCLPGTDCCYEGIRRQMSVIQSLLPPCPAWIKAVTRSQRRFYCQDVFKDIMARVLIEFLISYLESLMNKNSWMAGFTVVIKIAGVRYQTSP